MNRSFLMSLALTFLTLTVVAPARAGDAIRLGASEEEQESSTERRGVWLGVHVQDLDEALREAFDLQGSGVLVNRVVEDSPAEKAGLRVGDVITAVGGQSVEDVVELRRRLRDAGAGEVEVSYLRRGEKATTRAELGEAPRFQRRVDRGRRLRFMHAEGGFLGVRLAPLDGKLASYFDLEPGDGALVLSVVDESPAAEAGIEAGDVITSVDGDKISSPEELTRSVRALEAGKEVELGLVREGRKRTIRVTLGESPAGRMRRHVVLRPGDLHDSLDLDPERLSRLHEHLQGLPLADQALGKRLDKLEALLETLQKELETLKNDTGR